MARRRFSSQGVQVNGADQFYRLSKALKLAGQTEMRKGLHKGLRDGANKVKPDAAEALAASLPSGLSAKGRRVKQAVQVKTGRDPGVSIVVRYGKAGAGLSGHNAVAVNKTGTFRHPVYGTGAWVEQKAKASGWFDKTYTNKAPALRRDLERVIDDVADQVVRKARR